MDYIKNKERTFFTSDHHFGHFNIIGYEDRPFSDSGDMDESLVSEWNSVVSTGDIVYHLGDFSLSGDIVYVEDMFARLNGKINFMALDWHHDKRWLDKIRVLISADGEYVNLTPPMKVLYVRSENKYPLTITLSHYPMAEWEASHYDSWHLHGHSHGNYQDPMGRRVYDVGVDNNDFKPISFSDLERDVMVGGGE